MGKTRYTSYDSYLNNYSFYLGQIYRVLYLYKKKVTHKVICNLHNRNHDNQKILDFG